MAKKNRKPVCAFCNTEMKPRGVNHLGIGLNTLNFKCEYCGALASFTKHHAREIKVLHITAEYEEE